MDLSFGDPRITDITTIPKLISFGFYSSNEILNITSIEIFCPVFLDNKKSSIQGGLYDRRMGPETSKKICSTCASNYALCPGHFGFIDVAIPLVNPFLKNLYLLILKGKCWYCGFFRLPNWQLKIFWISLIFLGTEGEFFLQPKDKLKKNFHSFFEKKNWNFSLVSFKVLNSFESLVKTFLTKNCFKKNTILKQIKTKKRGENWCNFLSFFLEKGREKKNCPKCNRLKLEIRKFEEYKYYLQERSINIGQITFFQKKKLTIKKKKFFSYEKKNSHIKMAKNEGVSFKSFQGKEEIDSLWKYENELCELVWGSYGSFKNCRKNNGSYVFFINHILVPPNRFRRIDISKILDQKKQNVSNPQNFFFIQLLKFNQQLLLAIGTEKKNFSENWGTKSFFELEKKINNFFDNLSTSKRKDTFIGVRQQLEKKMGLFRMHLMGKRVFHSARSVIIPDPFLGGEEVGVPLFFAKKLTFPEPLNFLAFEKKTSQKISSHRSQVFFFENLKIFQTIFGKKLVLSDIKNGIKKAQLIEICFKYFNRYGINFNRNFGINKLYRFLKNQDLVLLNRQPSLHKVSIMAHRAKIIPGSKCIRMHYSNCNSYNADFDGDEMNLHFPQNYIAKSEGIFLSLASSHWKVPTDNSPIRGLIQDHIIISVFLTKKDTFLNQNIFSQLLNFLEKSNSVSNFFSYPAILKPRILWTGKQVISKFWELISPKTKSFFLESRTKLSDLSLGRDETKILVRNGQLLRGVLDASQLGKNKFGILGSFFEIFGGLLANDFLKGFSYILTFFQRIHGHSTRLDDLILLKKIDKNRTKIFKKEKIISRFYLRKVLSKKGIFLSLKLKRSQYFYLFSKIVAFLCSRRVFFSQYLLAIKNLLSQTFSKKIEKCVPGGLEKTFLTNGFSKMTISGAKGSIVNTLQVCLSLGQTELEGRCIPRGFCGKTLPCFPPFDVSPYSNGFISQRFLTGINQSDFFFHCMAGREGLLDTALKTSQSGYIQRSIVKHLEGHSIHYDFTTRFGKGNISQMIYSGNSISFSEKEISSLSNWFFQNFECFSHSFLPFLTQSMKKEKKKFLPSLNFFRNFFQCFWNIGNVQNIINQLFLSRRNFFPKFAYWLIKFFFLWTFSENLFEPGDPIGLITGQSLGEPCTQMTLNTFHFAGKLSSCGSIGVSRLQEILMTNSKRLKNPTMSAILKEDFQENSISFLEKRFNSIFLNDLLESASFHIEKVKNLELIIFRIKIYPKDSLKHQLILEINFILDKLENFWKKFKKQNIPLNYYRNFKKKKKCQKNQKGNIIIKKRTSRLNINKKSFYFTQLNQLTLTHPINRNRKIRKQKNLDFTINQLFGSGFCIRKIPRVSGCLLDLTEKTIHIQGINFFILWFFQDIIQVNKIFTNDLYSSLITYGIEGGRNFILNELLTVFQVQAISIARRHLDFASDYMTRLGNYRAFNRQGLKEENGLQKISYETAIRFIIENAVFKNSDEIYSVSSCIGLGQICKIGTGSFDLTFR